VAIICTVLIFALFYFKSSIDSANKQSKIQSASTKVQRVIDKDNLVVEGHITFIDIQAYELTVKTPTDQKEFSVAVDQSKSIIYKQPIEGQKSVEEFLFSDLKEGMVILVYAKNPTATKIIASGIAVRVPINPVMQNRMRNMNN